jgi:hypothetical protein
MKMTLILSAAVCGSASSAKHVRNRHCRRTHDE